MEAVIGRRDALTSTGRQDAVASTGNQDAIPATGGHYARLSPEREDTRTATDLQRDPLTSTGRQDALLTTTGSHRAIGKASRRRVAAWPIVAVVLVGLLVLGWFGWNWADGVLANRAEAQASTCQEGNASIRVVTAPSITKPVSVLAHRWNEERNVVHGHCIDVNVHAVRSDRVLDDLMGSGKGSFIDDTAAAWVPESTKTLNKVAEARPGLIGSQGESVASGPMGDYPYVGLAQDGVDAVQQRAAQSFRAYLLQQGQRVAFNDAGLSDPK